MVYGGLDLSAIADLTALVLIGRRDGKWHVHPTFWLPSEGLTEKSPRPIVSLTISGPAGASADYGGPDRVIRIRRPSAPWAVPPL